MAAVNPSLPSRASTSSVVQAVDGDAPRALDRVLRILLEFPIAALMLAEIMILFAGVVSRYVFHDPLGWADELASVLFLWIAMLGAAIAFLRGQHMRLTFFLEKLGPEATHAAETFGLLVALLFVAALIEPAARFVVSEHMITTPALGVPNSLRVLAIPVGLSLMGLISFLRLWRTASIGNVALVIVVIAVAALALYYGSPWLKSIGSANLLIFFVSIIVVTLTLGVPIGFAFGIATLTYVVFGTHVSTQVIVGRMNEGSSHFILLSVPMFVLLGSLMEVAGLARAMVGFLASLLGHVRGGLNYVLLGAMYLVSGISGSKVADMAAVAPVLFPEMAKRGEKPSEMVALLASAGAMSETIPPSLVLITVGSVTSISISALFTGGMLPALVLALALAGVCCFRSRDSVAVTSAPSWRTIGRSFLIALPALTLPFLIRFAVLDGVATATEVSTVGIVYTLLLGVFVYRPFAWRRLYGLMVDAGSMSGSILFIIGTASAMGWALTQSGFSRQLSSIMLTAPGGKLGFLLISIAAFSVLGSVLEGIPAVVLFAPLLFPIARGLGIPEVQYAMVMILSMGIGVFAPPIGIGYFIACAIGKVPPSEAMGPIWAYIAAMFAGLLLVAAAPWLSVGFL
jgi:tripartite ATP-independent transporter DctM subunit